VSVKAEVRACLLEAETALYLGDAAAAQALCDRVLVRAAKPSEARTRASALLLRGAACCQSGDHTTAYSSATEAYALLTEIADVPGALEAACLLVTVYCHAGDVTRAVETAKAGLELSVGHGAVESTVRLLRCLGHAMLLGLEYPEAIRCLSEAVASCDDLPRPLRLERDHLSLELAVMHQAYADHLLGHGHEALAREQIDKARALLALPLRELPSAASFDHARVLETRVHLQLGWQDLPGARHSALMLSRMARRPPRPPRIAAAALNALSAVHRARGHLERACMLQRRCLDVLSSLGLTAEVREAMQRLSQVQAAAGEYAAAIEWQRKAAKLQAIETVRGHALRSYVADRERQALRRSEQAPAQMLHSRRLLVFGRLLARIHHAVLSPLWQLDQTIDRARSELDAGAPTSRVVELLGLASRPLDIGSGIARQLKLFCYRSTPQSAAVSLEEELRKAWNGLQLYDARQHWLLDMQLHRSAAEALADPQRLGILLLILLAEIAPHERDAPGSVVWGQVEHDAGSAWVTLRIGAITSEVVDVTKEPSIDLALCAEIAREMSGELEGVYDEGVLREYRLALPFAEQVSTIRCS
jgi:tetratricopeptide (TPR) repeat protein